MAIQIDWHVTVCLCAGLCRPITHSSLSHNHQQKLPLLQRTSRAFPRGPKVFSVSQHSRCCQIRPRLCLLNCPPLFSAPRSFAPSSGGTSPGNRTPGRSRRFPSSRAPDWTTGRTSLPSCAASPCGRSSELTWMPPDVGRRSTRSPPGCSRRTLPSEIHGCCSLLTSPNVFVVACLTFATRPREGDPLHSAWLGGNMSCCALCPLVQVAARTLSGSQLYLTRPRISPWWLNGVGVGKHPVLWTTVGPVFFQIWRNKKGQNYFSGISFKMNMVILL